MAFAVLLLWVFTLIVPPLVIAHWAIKRGRSRLAACVAATISAPVACGFLFLAVADNTYDLEFALGVLGRFIFPSALVIGLLLSLIVSFVVHPCVT